MSTDYQAKHCKYCNILIYWVLDPEKRTSPDGSPRYIPLEALNHGIKHQCSKYDPPSHSGRDYNMFNPLESSAWLKKFLKLDMEKGKVWCLRCNMAHVSKAPCWWLREVGFTPHTEYYPKEEWSQPTMFFKKVHAFLMEQGHASLYPDAKPRDLQKRKILAAESSEKIF